MCTRLAHQSVDIFAGQYLYAQETGHIFNVAMCVREREHVRELFHARAAIAMAPYHIISYHTVVCEYIRNSKLDPQIP